jgi:hypothetical protein
MLDSYLSLCYEFHAVPFPGTRHSMQVPWYSNSAERMISMSGPWVTSYTSCVARAHLEIAALGNSSKYTADSATSIESSENNCEQMFKSGQPYGNSFRPSVNMSLSMGTRLPADYFWSVV